MLKSVVEMPTVNVFNMSTSKTLSYFVEEVDMVRKLEHQLIADSQAWGCGVYEGGTAMFLLLEDGQLLTNTGGPTAACKVRETAMGPAHVLVGLVMCDGSLVGK